MNNNDLMCKRLSEKYENYFNNAILQKIKSIEEEFSNFEGLYFDLNKVEYASIQISIQNNVSLKEYLEEKEKEIESVREEFVKIVENGAIMTTQELLSYEIKEEVMDSKLYIFVKLCSKLNDFLSLIKKYENNLLIVKNIILEKKKQFESLDKEKAIKENYINNKKETYRYGEEIPYWPSLIIASVISVIFSVILVVTNVVELYLVAVPFIWVAVLLSVVVYLINRYIIFAIIDYRECKDINRKRETRAVVFENIFAKKQEEYLKELKSKFATKYINIQKECEMFLEIEKRIEILRADINKILEVIPKEMQYSNYDRVASALYSHKTYVSAISNLKYVDGLESKLMEYEFEKRREEEQKKKSVIDTLNKIRENQEEIKDKQNKNYALKEDLYNEAKKQTEKIEEYTNLARDLRDKL